MFNSKKRVKDLSAPGSSGGSGGAMSSSGGVTSLGPPSAGNIQKLEMAKRLALRINAQKNLGAEAQVGPSVRRRAPPCRLSEREPILGARTSSNPSYSPVIRLVLAL